ncbi:UDP-N-acetylmuramate dehydrogenase [Spirochaeta dissipatitropha]
MKDYTSFRIGGPADLLAIPETEEQLSSLINWAAGKKIPWLVLGAGANILVSDKGIRGLTILSSKLQNFTITRKREYISLEIGAGMDVSRAAELCADEGLAGLDFLYGMPGSIGGAVWMNARCYGSEISGILKTVRCISSSEGIHTYHFHEGDWDYKLSPFQKSGVVILAAEFHLTEEDPENIRKRMKGHYEDRNTKGHFRHPSAGSTFKNNYDFGKPSGQIIDELNLRGKSIGGAQIAPYHGNIFINKGDATAADMKKLIDEVQKTVQEATGLRLDPEVQFIGDWN